MKVELLAVLILLIGLGILGVWIYIVRQGDSEIEILTAQRTELQLVSAEDGRAVFVAQIPLCNLSAQDGIILDAFPRHLLPQEQYDAARVESRLELLTAPREDGYFEAVIIEGNKGKLGKNGIWTYRALNSDYYIFKHEYIFVFKKPIFQLLARAASP